MLLRSIQTDLIFIIILAKTLILLRAYEHSLVASKYALKKTRRIKTPLTIQSVTQMGLLSKTT